MPAPAMLKAMPLPPAPPVDDDEVVAGVPDVSERGFNERDDTQGIAQHMEGTFCPSATCGFEDVAHVANTQEHSIQDQDSPSAEFSTVQPENDPMVQAPHVAKTLLEQMLPRTAIATAEAQLDIAKDSLKGNTSVTEANVDVIKQLVTSFAQKAVKGYPCKCVRPGTVVPARFLLDRKLDNFSIVTAGDCLEQIMTCELTSVEEIYSYSEDGQSVFKPEILSEVDEDSQCLLVMLALSGNVDDATNVYLMLDSSESLDPFVIGMKVLVEGKHSQVRSSPTSTLGNASKCGRCPTTVGPVIAARSFLRELGVQALQSVPKTALWRTTAEVAPYLAQYGYATIDHTNWKAFGNDTNMHPSLSFRVSQHFEAARHTWYIVETRVGLKEQPSSIEWLAPRRLEYLRKDLHDIIKSALGQKAYAKCFDGARFAPHGGLPGTTAHLRRWFDALAACINSKAVPPLALAVTFRFLEAPTSE